MKKAQFFKLGILILLIMSFLSCESSDKKDENNIDGVWKSVGYGRIANIEDGEFTLADVTDISCMPLMEGNISDFGDKLKLQNDTLSLKDGINNYLFVRIEEAPAACENDSQEYAKNMANANDPEYNFEVLWHTFIDHYAYFELRNVDPKKMYAEYRPKVTSETTEAELFLVLYEMLESFNDGHIDISATDEIEDEASMLYQAKKAKQDATSEEASEEPVKRLRNHSVAQLISNKYIPEGL